MATKIQKLERKLDEVYAQIMTLTNIVEGDDSWSPVRIEASIELGQLQNQAERLEDHLSHAYVEEANQSAKLTR